MIMENTGQQGDVDIQAFQRAMLTYRNTPTLLDNRHPAEIVFGRQIRAFVPVMPGKYVPCDTWTNTAANREKAIMECHAKDVEALLPHTKKMPPLKVGNRVRIQNQTGMRHDAGTILAKSSRSGKTTSMPLKCTDLAESLFETVNSFGCTSRTRRSRAPAASLMTSLTGPLTLRGCHYPYSRRRI